jgi:hypothetical protein
VKIKQRKTETDRKYKKERAQVLHVAEALQALGVRENVAWDIAAQFMLGRAVCYARERERDGHNKHYERLVSWGKEVSLNWAKKVLAVEKLRRARVSSEIAESAAKNELTKFEKNPRSERADAEEKEQDKKAEQDEAERWWKREGRYEEALEDAGEIKTHHYSQFMAESSGERPPTAKETAEQLGLSA